MARTDSSPDLAGDPAQNSDCNGQATSIGYYLAAVPITIKLTGHRAFASTSPGVIYFDPNGVAPTEAQMQPNGGATPVQ